MHLASPPQEKMPFLNQELQHLSLKKKKKKKETVFWLGFDVDVALALSV